MSTKTSFTSLFPLTLLNTHLSPSTRVADSPCQTSSQSKASSSSPLFPRPTIVWRSFKWDRRAHIKYKLTRAHTPTGSSRIKPATNHRQATANKLNNQLGNDWGKAAKLRSTSWAAPKRASTQLFTRTSVCELETNKR